MQNLRNCSNSCPYRLCSGSDPGSVIRNNGHHWKSFNKQKEIKEAAKKNNENEKHEMSGLRKSLLFARNNNVCI